MQEFVRSLTIKWRQRGKGSRFSERAAAVLVVARDEAQRLGRPLIESEHLLLALVAAEDSSAGRVLQRLGVSYLELRELVVRVREPTPCAAVDELGESAKVAIRESVMEWYRSGQAAKIDTADLLAGLLRDDESPAAQILLDFNVTLKDVRRETIRERNGWELGDG